MKATTKSEKERREYPRLKISIPIHYFLCRSGKLIKITASTKNVGGSGACLKLDEQIAVLTHLELQIKLPNSLCPVAVQGKIVWCEKMPSSPKYMAGVVFSGINEEDRREIVNYVAKTLK